AGGRRNGAYHHSRVEGPGHSVTPRPFDALDHVLDALGLPQEEVESVFLPGRQVPPLPLSAVDKGLGLIQQLLTLPSKINAGDAHANPLLPAHPGKDKSRPRVRQVFHLRPQTRLTPLLGPVWSWWFVSRRCPCIGGL